MAMMVLVASSVRAARAERGRWHHPRGHGCAGRTRDAHKTCVSPLGTGTWLGDVERPEGAVPPLKSPRSP